METILPLNLINLLYLLKKMQQIVPLAGIFFLQVHATLSVVFQDSCNHQGRRVPLGELHVRFIVANYSCFKSAQEVNKAGPPAINSSTSNHIQITDEV